MKSAGRVAGGLFQPGGILCSRHKVQRVLRQPAGRGQRRKAFEGELARLAVNPVARRPALSAVRLNDEVEAGLAGVGDFQPLARVWFEPLDSRNTQSDSHGQSPLGARGVPRVAHLLPRPVRDWE